MVLHSSPGRRRTSLVFLSLLSNGVYLNDWSLGISEENFASRHVAQLLMEMEIDDRKNLVRGKSHG